MGRDGDDPYGRTMPSLHIEHAVTDLDTWSSVFQSFGPIRAAAGVVAEIVRHVEGDDRFVVIDLEFDTSEHAHGFLHFLRTEVWAEPAASPALAGTPEAKVLEPVSGPWVSDDRRGIESDHVPP
jgi:hypothetical protein